MLTMTVLGLDLGTRIMGYCLWDIPNGVVVMSGTEPLYRFADELPGYCFMRFRAWLMAMGDRFGRQAIIPSQRIYAYEMPHFRGGAATLLLLGLVAHVEEMAARLAVPTMSVHSKTLKKFATGNGNASKEDMVAAARPYLPCNDTIMHDEADAVHVARWAAAQLQAEAQ